MRVIEESRTQRVWLSGRGADAWRIVLESSGRGRVARGSQSIGFGSPEQLRELKMLLDAVPEGER